MLYMPLLLLHQLLFLFGSYFRRCCQVCRISHSAHNVTQWQIVTYGLMVTLLNQSENFWRSQRKEQMWFEKLILALVSLPSVALFPLHIRNRWTAFWKVKSHLITLADSPILFNFPSCTVVSVQESCIGFSPESSTLRSNHKLAPA